jgi:hypothetical protein
VGAHQVEATDGLGVGHDFDADHQAVAHGEGEHGHGLPADGDDRSGQAVDETQPRGACPTGEDRPAPLTTCAKVAPDQEGGAYIRAVPRPGGGSVVIMTLLLLPDVDPADTRAALSRALTALMSLVEDG